MSRSASDATRFTATSPQAYSKPSTFRSSGGAQSSSRGVSGGGGGGGASRGPPPPSSQGRPGGAGGGRTDGGGGGKRPPYPTETPQEKVARLRAAHAAKRAAEISTWDHVVIRGRSLADAAHRVTIMGLVGLSVVAGAVTIYSFIDLSAHNRQKKREWLAAQYENLQKELVEASRAERAGIATPEQLLLLNRERAAEQARVEKENRKGITSYIGDLFSTKGLKKEESAESTEFLPDLAKTETVTSAISSLHAEQEGPVMKAINEQRRQGERVLEAQGAQGGLLDQTAEQAVDQTKKSARSWSSWLGFGSK